MTQRDTQAERCWLESAEQEAGASGFARHAVERLRAGEIAYGDRWATAGLPGLMAELMEEAADLGAWAVLALQALGDVTNLDPAERALVSSALRAAILWGAYAHHALTLGLDHLNPPQAGAAPTGRFNAETSW